MIAKNENCEKCFFYNEDQEYCNFTTCIFLNADEYGY